MNIFILPISGGGFTIQLGIICFFLFSVLSYRQKTALTFEPFKPDIVLGSSGGNIAAYICTAASWDPTRIIQVASKIRSEAFITRWTTAIPGWFFLPFSKSVFRPGYGFRPLFHFMFGETLQNAPEIWTGTFHAKSGRHQLFTNRAEGETVLNPLPSTFALSDGISPPLYANGDVDLIADFTFASSSIPVLSQSVEIQGEEYRDGGIVSASPLSILALPILELSQRPLKLFYVASDNPFSLLPSSSPLVPARLAPVVRATTHADIRHFVLLLTSLGAASEPTFKLFERGDIEDSGLPMGQLLDATTNCAILFFPLDGSRGHVNPFFIEKAEALENEISTVWKLSNLCAFVWLW